jgi:hypothetical protein
MTVGDWLAQRSPVPPEVLGARIRDALAGRLAAGVATVPEACLAASEERLVATLAEPGKGRESALDLLAADALITYALEHVAETSTTVQEWAGGAMHRIAAHGVGRPMGDS